MLEEGYSLNDAIEFMSLQMDKDETDMFRTAITELKNGEKFLKVLQRLNFDPVAISFTFYGEENGQLAQSLQTASRLLSMRDEGKEKLRKLLNYPRFLLAASFIMFLTIGWQLVPQFIHLYKSFQAEPNWLIIVFFRLQQHPWIVLTILAAFAFLISMIFYKIKKKKTDYEIQILISNFPFAGSLLKLWNTYYVGYHMSLLLKNGLSLADTLIMLKKDPVQRFLNEIMEEIQQSILAGEKLDEAVGKIPIWQNEFGRVITHGQLSGKLDIELYSYSQYCLDLFFERLEKLLKAIQPITFGIVALWIIFMYFSILMPSFQMIQYI